MHPIFNEYAPATASTTYFAASVTGGTWVLTNLTTPDGYGHQITITNNTATDFSASTVTIVGTSYAGKIWNGTAYVGFPQTTTINLPGPNDTVTTSTYFKTLTSVTPSATIGAATMSIGYNDQFSSTVIPTSSYGKQMYAGVGVTGTANYTIQYTGDDVFTKTPAVLGRDYIWISDSAAETTNSTTSAADTFTSAPIAVRLITNSYTGTPRLLLTLTQMFTPR